MRNHNIFTLGIILSCIYGINAMADWPTTAATDVWTNSEHTTPAQMRCGDCCKTDCWLPNGKYYDNKGTFTETCTGEPSQPTCDSHGQYSVVNGQCKLSSCDSDNGYYISGNSCAYCNKYSFNTAEYGDISNCQKLARNINCTSVNVSGSSCSCANYSYGPWYAAETGKYLGDVCVFVSEDGYADGYWDFDGSKGGNNIDTYGLTAGGQWGVTFYGGNVKGIASCNGTEGTFGKATDQEFSNTANGSNCWCKITSPAASRWVFYTSKVYGISSDDCVSDCAYHCAWHVRGDRSFRRGVFDSVE